MSISSLPPEPKIRLDSELFSLLAEADKSLYFLNGALSLLSDNHTIVSALSLLEALYSKNIDGYSPKHVEIFKLLLDEDQNELRNIYSYLSALALGQKLIRDVASSSHIIKSIHKELSRQIQDEDNQAGEFRKKGIWLGQYSTSATDAKYIPPPPEEIARLMNELENYIASDISYPVVINAALIHAQFEMIHPFNTNNGLVGRILFQLHFLWKKRLSVPVIQISNVFLKKRTEYFERLENLEKNNNWESWIKFFLRAVIDAASHTVNMIKNIYALEKNDYEIILNNQIASTISLRFYDLLFRRPIITLPFVVKELGLNKQTANVLISKFIGLNILQEITGMQRNRIFIYKKLTAILEK